MPGFLDRLGKSAQQAAAAAQQQANEARIRLDVRNIGGRLDEKAQVLGHLMFRQHRGETIPEEEYMKVLDEMTQIESQRQAKEVELEDMRSRWLAQQGTAAGPAPAPAPAATPPPPPPAETVACPHCGAANAAGAKFCTECGKAIAG